MLATKKRVVHGLQIAVLAVLLAGCTPPGPRALLDGKRLLDRGDNNEAVARLQTAVSLLSTNAQAWNYLGVAYHRVGQTTNAVAAYQKALALDRNLLEARFNLGCLWLDTGKPEAARTEFTAYTLRRPNAPEGWTKLGFAQLELRELSAAEKSFSQSVSLSAQNPDAYNGIGLAQLQRNRPRDAAQYFASALKQQPDHRAALLNLARVTQGYLNDPQTALRCYRSYLALTPRAPDWEIVNAVAESIDRQLTAQQKPAQTNAVTQVAAATPTVVTAPATSTPPVVTPTATAAKTEPSKPALAPAPVVAKPQSSTPVAKPVEVVSLPPEPVIRTTPITTAPPPSKTAPITSTEQTEPEFEAPPVVSRTPSQPEKRGFFQKLNPMNLFRKETQATPLPPPRKAELIPIPPQPTPSTVADDAVVSKPAASSPPRVQSHVRFAYASTATPPAGDRIAANQAFAQGVKMREAGRMSDAADAFRSAVKADASFFEAQFNLALAEYQLAHYKQSMAAWQVALAIRPDSADARYNFALTLTVANYPVDAAVEFERLLLVNPDDARAHLAVGNLYAGPLQDKASARAHYLRVLEIAPAHSQSSAIHYWLISNPQQ